MTSPENVGPQFQDYIHMTSAKSVVGIIDAIHRHETEGGRKHPLTGLYVRPEKRAGLMEMYGKHGLVIRGPAKPTVNTSLSGAGEFTDAYPDHNHFDEEYDSVDEIGDYVIGDPTNWKVTGTIHPVAIKDGKQVHIEDLEKKLNNEERLGLDNVEYRDDSGRVRG
jgi:hypothetical protein